MDGGSLMRPLWVVVEQVKGKHGLTWRVASFDVALARKYAESQMELLAEEHPDRTFRVWPYYPEEAQ
jgi:hypothetical protein